jgi:hypothetical protein
LGDITIVLILLAAGSAEVEGGLVPLGAFSPHVWVKSAPHAFTIPEAGPHHLFEREGPERLPIHEVMSEADLSVQVQRPDVLALAERVAQETFERRMQHELERVLALGERYRTYAGEVE